MVESCSSLAAAIEVYELDWTRRYASWTSGSAPTCEFRSQYDVHPSRVGRGARTRSTTLRSGAAGAVFSFPLARVVDILSGLE